MLLHAIVFRFRPMTLALQSMPGVDLQLYYNICSFIYKYICSFITMLIYSFWPMTLALQSTPGVEVRSSQSHSRCGSCVYIYIYIYMYTQIQLSIYLSLYIYIYNICTYTYKCTQSQSRCGSRRALRSSMLYHIRLYHIIMCIYIYIYMYTHIMLYNTHSYYNE